MTIPFWTENGTIDLTTLRHRDLAAGVLADTLSRIHRFGGRPPQSWSVAAHLCLVEHLCPLDLKPWAVLHDASAAFLGDLMSPALEFICRSGSRVAVENAVRNARGRIDRSIASAWAVTVRSASQSLREADLIAVQAEAMIFLGIRPEFLARANEEAFDRALTFILEQPCLGSRDARDFWLSRVEHLASLGLLSPPKAEDPSGMVPGGQS